MPGVPKTLTRKMPGMGSRRRASRLPRPADSGGPDLGAPTPPTPPPAGSSVPRALGARLRGSAAPRPLPPGPGSPSPLSKRLALAREPAAGGGPTTCCARRPPSASGSPAPGGAGGGPRLSPVGEGSGGGRGGAGAPGPRGQRSSPGGGPLRLTRCPPPPVAAGEWGQVRPPNPCSLRPRRRRQPLRPLFIKLFCLVVRPVTRPPGRAPGLADAGR